MKIKKGKYENKKLIVKGKYENGNTVLLISELLFFSEMIGD